MTDYSTYSPIGAGSPDLHSNPSVLSTPDVPSTPGIPSSPTANVTGSDGFTSYPPTPQGLSRRQLNLFKRQRKAALKLAMLMATELKDPTSSPSTFHHVTDTENDTDIPGDYKRGDLGRQARKLFKSKDKHGMLSPNTHKVVKPAVIMHYQYKKCYKTARKMAEMRAKKTTRMA
ncbi:hypothetical protein D6C90_09960 [Aureobasidium pullulans]|uniref:Uncharacterized protein n=1 Tax=Aureobasidium pullulans TaxID=5580 RepID=A0A4S9SXS3_AURPU|nr:hypothetical protein D6C90_09960 [Aureobasidium pullulans]